jgi:hypothetical protein
MADLGFEFNADEVEINVPFEVLPPGDYEVQIVNSEMRPTKSGTGKYLWMEMAVISGEYKERRIFDRLNLFNDNEKAANIAHGTLGAITKAVGKLTIKDSDELHFLPFVAAVKVRPAGPDKSGVQRDAQNEVKGYKPLKDGPRPAATNASPTAPVTPSWRRKA